MVDANYATSHKPEDRRHDHDRRARSSRSSASSPSRRAAARRTCTSRWRGLRRWPSRAGQRQAMKNEVNTVYVTAASAARHRRRAEGDRHGCCRSATITTPSSLASEVTGSVSTAAKLANDLGKWLAVLVLIAAFAVASLLTMAAVARRVREFGTLKALGWRSTPDHRPGDGRVIRPRRARRRGSGSASASPARRSSTRSRRAVRDHPSRAAALLVHGRPGRPHHDAGRSALEPDVAAHTVSVPLAASVSGAAIARRRGARRGRRPAGRDVRRAGGSAGCARRTHCTKVEVSDDVRADRRGHSVPLTGSAGSTGKVLAIPAVAT